MHPQLIPIEQKVNKSALLRLFDRLEIVSEPAMTIYLPPGFNVSEVANITEVIPESEKIPVEAIDEAAKSESGAFFLWGQSFKYLILPPFPMHDKFVVYGYQVEQYRRMLTRELTIAVIIIRLGNYAIGLFKGEKLISSKVGTGLVHARHRKGGSSQRRFERHREKQIEYFFNRVCERTTAKLSEYVSDIDFIFYGGERNTVRKFVGSCEFLKTFEGRTKKKLLNIREARQKTLALAVEEVWSSKIIEWKLPQDDVE